MFRIFVAIDALSYVGLIARANIEITDEFYSAYLYTNGCQGETVSSAKYVEGISVLLIKTNPQT